MYSLKRVMCPPPARSGRLYSGALRAERQLDPTRRLREGRRAGLRSTAPSQCSVQTRSLAITISFVAPSH
jgi:hypothetical protein